MTLAKKQQQRRQREPESDAQELARLTHEQADDLKRGARSRQRRKHIEYAERAGTSRVSTRLQGDELREHVVWYARRELKRAELELPTGLLAHFSRQRSRQHIDRQAAMLQRDIARTVELAREWLHANAAHGGAATAELAAIVAQVRPVFPELAAMRAMRACLRGEVCRVADPVVEAPRGQLNLRVVIAERLRGRGWTDRLRACASLVLGNWPEVIGADEPLDPLEVLKIERDTVKQARTRHVTK